MDARKIPPMYLDSLQILDDDPGFVLEKQVDRETEVLRCYPRNPSDGRIDWSLGSTDIIRLINASGKPYSGAFCYLGEEILRVWDAHDLEIQTTICAVPGQIIEIKKDYFDIVCGVGAIRIMSCSFKGHTVRDMRKIIKSLRSRVS